MCHHCWAVRDSFFRAPSVLGDGPRRSMEDFLGECQSVSGTKSCQIRNSSRLCALYSVISHVVEGLLGIQAALQ